MKKTVAAFAIAAGMVAVPGMAQAQNVAPGGFYVGALAGYEGLDVESGDGNVSADADSAVYGVTAGYDLSLGSAFVGVEGELSTSSGSTQFPDSFGGARDILGSRAQPPLLPAAVHERVQPGRPGDHERPDADRTADLVRRDTHREQP